jgi:hypothetical protein
MKLYCKESMTTKNVYDQIFIIEKGKSYNYNRGLLDNIIYITDDNDIVEVFTEKYIRYNYLNIRDYFYTSEEIRKIKLDTI